MWCFEENIHSCSSSEWMHLSFSSSVTLSRHLYKVAINNLPQQLRHGWISQLALFGRRLLMPLSHLIRDMSRDAPCIGSNDCLLRNGKLFASPFVWIRYHQECFCLSSLTHCCAYKFKLTGSEFLSFILFIYLFFDCRSSSMDCHRNFSRSDDFGDHIAFCFMKMKDAASEKQIIPGTPSFPKRSCIVQYM